jgi:hypothetical protein
MYTYTNLQNAIKVQTKGSMSDAEWLELINLTARIVAGDADLMSMRRKSTLSPFLFDDIYDYAVPTDLKNDCIADIKPQINRSTSDEWRLTEAGFFDRNKQTQKNIFAIANESGSKRIRLSAEIDDTTLLVSGLDSTTDGGGTWTALGDATTPTSDSDYFVKGSASINYGINASGGTTAGIQNTDLDTFDITEFVSNSSVFVWAYVSSTTGLTNFIIKIGNDSSNYYTKTITTTNEGTSFVAGWNLLRFDFASSTKSGTVDTDACKYVALFMTKAGSKVNEIDYRFDQIQIKKGQYSDIIYYSRYPWQTSAGVWILDSTTATDCLNAGSDEFNLFTLKGIELALNHYRNVSNLDDVQIAKKDYKEALNEYKMLHPSECKPVTYEI